MVAVRMVSEGVDVPRLCVGVYATSASTPLYFAQAIGRFVRARRRGELATVFLPSVPVLLRLGSELERERDHALDRETADDALLDDGLLDDANRADDSSSELADEFEWEALASDRDLREGAVRRRGVRFARHPRKRRGMGFHRHPRNPRTGAGVGAAQAPAAASGAARR